MARIDTDRLNRELARRGLTGRDLSRLSGVSEVTLSRLRSGRGVRPSTIVRLSRALLAVEVIPGVDWLMTGTEPAAERV